MISLKSLQRKNGARQLESDILKQPKHMLLKLLKEDHWGRILSPFGVMGYEHLKIKLLIKFDDNSAF